MKKIVALALLSFFIGLQFLAVPAYAQELGTLLPQPKEETMTCEDLLIDYEEFLDPVEEFKKNVKDDPKERNEVLGCAIKTGRIKFWMVPYFIIYIIDFIIAISGLIAILFIIIGGYQFVIAGATEKKDTAKATIKHALLGLILVLVAWVVVNVVQYAITL